MSGLIDGGATVKVAIANVFLPNEKENDNEFSDIPVLIEEDIECTIEELVNKDIVSAKCTVDGELDDEFIPDNTIPYILSYTPTENSSSEVKEQFIQQIIEETTDLDITEFDECHEAIENYSYDVAELYSNLVKGLANKWVITRMLSNSEKRKLNPKYLKYFTVNNTIINKTELIIGSNSVDAFETVEDLVLEEFNLKIKLDIDVWPDV